VGGKWAFLSGVWYDYRPATHTNNMNNTIIIIIIMIIITYYRDGDVSRFSQIISSPGWVVQSSAKSHLKVDTRQSPTELGTTQNPDHHYHNKNNNNNKNEVILSRDRVLKAFEGHEAKHVWISLDVVAHE